MAPQQDDRHDGRRKNGRFPHPPRSSTVTGDDDIDDEDEDLPTSTAISPYSELPMATTTIETLTDPLPTHVSTRVQPPYGPLPPNTPYFPGGHQGQSRTQSLETSTRIPPQSDHADSTVSPSPTRIEGDSSPFPSSTTIDGFGGRPPFGPGTQRHSNNVPLYAAAAIVPVIVLVIIGAVFCVCLRRRKRKNQNVRAVTPEMKLQPKPVERPYIAPPVATRRPSSSNHLPPTSQPSQLQPVILGPILSSSNGAYMTGMDTSDVVSITSNNLRPTDPFADNSSLMEPPPPYRPSSVAPPSFVSTSRQSSLRAHDHLPTSSQTHLIERSPFEDPDDDVSEISGPIQGRSNDTMSIVSDLSYQRDPVVNRSAI